MRTPAAAAAAAAPRRAWSGIGAARRVDRIHVHLRACNWAIARGRYERRRERGRGRESETGMREQVGEGEGATRSRSRREKPSKCRGSCASSRRATTSRWYAAECRGVQHRADRRSSIHRRADAREGRGENEKEEEKERAATRAREKREERKKAVEAEELETLDAR